MRVYFIDIPEVSSGLRRTYHKKLEVYSGELKECTNRYGYVSNIAYADTIYKYQAKKGWVEKPYNSKSKVVSDKNIHSTMPNISSIGSDTGFTSLELAQAAKMLLINDMREQYERQLVELKEMLARNVPDVSDAVNELKAEHPELFL